jgi:glutamate racemase
MFQFKCNLIYGYKACKTLFSRSFQNCSEVSLQKPPPLHDIIKNRPTGAQPLGRTGGTGYFKTMSAVSNQPAGTLEKDKYYFGAARQRSADALMDEPVQNKPIAMFDSGLGGLTVVSALQELMPNESIIYFGDTARVPYGIKSSQTVLQFAEQDCHFLLRFKPKLVIVACNTASAWAIDHLERHNAVPVLGVVKPGAAEAVRQADGGGIAVLATESTVVSEAYPKAIHALSPYAPVTQQRCPSLVSLIEEGRTPDDPALRMILDEYLERVRPLNPAVALLGCTHYPLIQDAVAELMPDSVVVDSAHATARRARQVLMREDRLSTSEAVGRLQCYVSDNPQRFREVGGRFLGRPLRNVTWISPEQFFNQEALHDVAEQSS